MCRERGKKRERERERAACRRHKRCTKNQNIYENKYKSRELNMALGRYKGVGSQNAECRRYKFRRPNMALKRNTDAESQTAECRRYKFRELNMALKRQTDVESQTAECRRRENGMTQAHCQEQDNVEFALPYICSNTDRHVIVHRERPCMRRSTHVATTLPIANAHVALLDRHA